MPPSASPKADAKSNGHKSEDIDGKLNEWKFEPPYKIHDDAENFKALYNGECHCGRVKYQLSREKPLEAKFCHCRTCQVLHGRFPSLQFLKLVWEADKIRSTIPMGSHFP